MSSNCPMRKLTWSYKKQILEIHKIIFFRFVLYKVFFMLLQAAIDLRIIFSKKVTLVFLLRVLEAIPFG